MRKASRRTKGAQRRAQSAFALALWRVTGVTAPAQLLCSLVGHLFHRRRSRPLRRRQEGTLMATTIYEHNFGFWEIDGQVEQAFFEYIQRQSVQKTCDRCARRVRLMPPKTLCASCVSALECGAPTTMSRYRHAGPKTGAGP